MLSVSHCYFTSLLTLVSQLQEKLGLSYKNSNELNKIVDSLPTRPKFNRSEITIGGETLDVYHRDIVECIRALYGDAEFAPHLVFKLERHYVDQDRITQIYSDMHT